MNKFETVQTRAQVLITQGEKFVLIFRHKNGEDYYAMPGGGVELNETAKEAARRETQEELGLDLKNLKLYSEVKTDTRHDFNFTAQTNDKNFVIEGPEKKHLYDPNDFFQPQWHTKNSLKKGIPLYPETAREMLTDFLETQTALVVIK